MALGCPKGQKLGIHWPDIERPWPFASPGKEFPDAQLSSFQSGMFTTWTGYAAQYTVSDTTSGRGTMILPPLVGGVPQSLNMVFYIVNAGKLFAMEVDPVTILTPFLNGVVLQQQSATGSFSNASLNGGMVMYLTGRSASGCGKGTGPAPNVLVGLLLSAPRADRVWPWRPMPRTPYPHSQPMEEELLEGAASSMWFPLRSLWWFRRAIRIPQS